jgi:hypothetical protein
VTQLAGNDADKRSGYGLHRASNNRKNRPKETTVSDQQDRKLQHTDEQKPVSEQKSGNQPTPPVQQRQENTGDRPRGPQSELEKPEQEKKKQA